MKVIHVNTYDVGGGAEQVSMDLSQNQGFSSLLVKKKYSQFTNVIEMPQFELDKMISFVDKILWKVNIRNGFKSFFFLGEQLNQTLRKLKSNKFYKEADIVHLHNIHGNFFDLDALRDIAKDKKILWTLHDMWPITGGEAFVLECDSYKTGKVSSAIRSLPPLNNPVVDRRNFFLNKKKDLYKTLGPNLCFVAVSNWLLERVKESYVYDSMIPLHVIHNGINTNVFKNDNKRDWKVPRLLFIDSSSPYKGSNLFTSIINEINYDLELWVIGNEVPRINNPRIKLRKLNRLNNRNELASVYNKVDILVFPSIAENFPLTILEAMSCGVFIISSNVGGIPEIINSNAIGALFTSNDAQSLLETIHISLCDLNGCRKKGMIASEEIRRRYDLKDTLQSYFSLYESLLRS